MSTLEELQAKAAAILKSCEHWKSCQDGSYEMALHYAGYDALCKQIWEYKNERTN
jgi:hypothetical protein